VPGTAALTKGHAAGITSVSCASAGNCSAGGYYWTVGGGGRQAFVVSEVRGGWRKAEEVPGTAALNQGENAQITSVSCASPGNCSAAGYYWSRYRGYPESRAFVVSEVNGTWRKAEELPGTAALTRGAGAQIASVSCASAGNCSAGGYYASFRGGPRHALVVSEVNGTWRKAEEVPGTAALKNGDAQTASVSCASAGNCSAGGFYAVAVGGIRAFVVSEVNGTWQNAEEMPGTAALNGGNIAEMITSVSCASVGNCSAGGEYGDLYGATSQVFVVSEVNGTWQNAEEVPGIAALDTGLSASITSVSCGAAGNCSAGGEYGDPYGATSQVFVVSEVNGTWQNAEEVPGTAALNKGDAQIASVSCASAGNCSTGGSYQNMYDGAQQAFVVSEVNGTWRKAEEVPGTAAFNKVEYAGITSVSCSSAGRCSAGGYYTHFGGRAQAFVVSRKVISRK
jgi:hypothetical protein